jgi:hypothetical protein
VIEFIDGGETDGETNRPPPPEIWDGVHLPRKSVRGDATLNRHRGGAGGSCPPRDTDGGGASETTATGVDTGRGVRGGGVGPEGTATLARWTVPVPAGGGDPSLAATPSTAQA